MLTALAGWEQHPSDLTTMAYKWCSEISKNHPNPTDGKDLLFLSLEVGFRHLNPQNPQILAGSTKWTVLPWMVDIVFKSGSDEVIADLLHAWTSHSDPSLPLSECAGRLVDLQHSSPRLQRLVIWSVELIGPQGFRGVAVEKFAGLLDHLDVGVEDMDAKDQWANLLTSIIQHPDGNGVQHLSHPYWELLVELSLLGSLQPGDIACDPDIMTNLEAGQEWGKLECWMGIVWMLWPPETGITTQENLGRVLLLLSRQQPGAIPKLEQWIEWWSVSQGKAIPESFQQISS